jgi:transposase
MEKRNRYTPKQKLGIALEGLRGQISITELYRKHGITSTIYYKWRNIFLRKGEENVLAGMEQMMGKVDYWVNSMEKERWFSFLSFGY